LITLWICKNHWVIKMGEMCIILSSSQ
jgi:hypothetical protein